VNTLKCHSHKTHNESATTNSWATSWAQNGYGIQDVSSQQFFSDIMATFSPCRDTV